MKKIILSVLLLTNGSILFSQLNPAITNWLQNTTQTGSYYTTGNSTPISNNILVNCQEIQYSANWV